MDDAQRSLTEVAAELRAGKVSSVELTHECLARAHRLQPVLNCFISIDDELALQQAAAADRALARGGPLGPLHGVPLAHKDMYYRAGRETTCGSRIRSGVRDTTTATLLTRLSAAGAINVGTLNMTEFALGPTGHNAIHGDCHNPWQPRHIPCGSSSGSGAAVAARIVYGSLGSDTGGSIRLPASATGLVGIKPTYSRLSRAGMMGLSHSIDTPGIVARTAKDCARLLAVVAGQDAADSTSSRRSVPDYEAAIAGTPSGLRIGIADNFYFDQATPEIRQLIDRAIDVLDTAGLKIVRVAVPQPEHLTELSRTIVYAEASSLHGQWLRTQGEQYSPQVRVRASTGAAIPAALYLEAQQLRPLLLRRFVSDVFSQCDVLCTPTLSMPVPTLADTDVGGGAAMWGTIAALVHCTAPFNYLGVPALSLPVGFTANGLPAGMQLVARPFAEATLLQIAAAFQQLTDWHHHSPALAS